MSYAAHNNKLFSGASDYNSSRLLLPRRQTDLQKLNPIKLAGYDQVKLRGTNSMAASSDKVSWSNFNSIISVIVVVLLAVLGGAFAWLRSEVSETRTDIRENRTAFITAKDDLIKSVSGVEKQIAITNTKLDTLIEQVRVCR